MEKVLIKMKKNIFLLAMIFNEILFGAQLEQSRRLPISHEVTTVYDDWNSQTSSRFLPKSVIEHLTKCFSLKNPRVSTEKLDNIEVLLKTFRLMFTPNRCDFFNDAQIILIMSLFGANPDNSFTSEEEKECQKKLLNLIFEVAKTGINLGNVNYVHNCLDVIINETSRLCISLVAGTLSITGKRQNFILKITKDFELEYLLRQFCIGYVPFSANSFSCSATNRHRYVYPFNKDCEDGIFDVKQPSELTEGIKYKVSDELKDIESINTLQWSGYVFLLDTCKNQKRYVGTFIFKYDSVNINKGKFDKFYGLVFVGDELKYIGGVDQENKCIDCGFRIGKCGAWYTATLKTNIFSDLTASIIRDTSSKANSDTLWSFTLHRKPDTYTCPRGRPLDPSSHGRLQPRAKSAKIPNRVFIDQSVKPIMSDGNDPTNVDSGKIYLNEDITCSCKIGNCDGRFFKGRLDEGNVENFLLWNGNKITCTYSEYLLNGMGTVVFSDGNSVSGMFKSGQLLFGQDDTLTFKIDEESISLKGMRDLKFDVTSKYPVLTVDLHSLKQRIMSDEAIMGLDRSITQLRQDGTVPEWVAENATAQQFEALELIPEFSMPYNRLKLCKIQYKNGSDNVIVMHTNEIIGLSIKYDPDKQQGDGKYIAHTFQKGFLTKRNEVLLTHLYGCRITHANIERGCFDTDYRDGKYKIILTICELFKSNKQAVRFFTVSQIISKLSNIVRQETILEAFPKEEITPSTIGVLIHKWL